MEVKIKQLQGVKFEASTRGHRVICDQPPENGGLDTAMTPPEYLLVALGTCAGFYANQYLSTKGLPSEGIEISVSADKVPAPMRMENFKIEVTAPQLDPRHEAALIRAVKSCLIHVTLHNEPSIETVLRAPALQGDNRS